MGCGRWGSTPSGKLDLKGYSALAYVAREISAKTRLNQQVVAAWIRLECGPYDNPLGIMHGSQLARFPNADAGIAATVTALRRYHPEILKSASEPPTKQIHTIAFSTWDSPQDPMHGAPYEKAMRGIYTTFTHTPTEVADVAKTTGEAAAAAAAALLGIRYRRGLGKIIGGASRVGGSTGVATKAVEAAGAAGAAIELEQHAPVALGYVVLSVAAVALFVIGLMRLSGGSPQKLVLAVRGRRAARGEIPF